MNTLLECQIFRMEKNAIPANILNRACNTSPASYLLRPYKGVTTQIVTLSSNHVSSVPNHGLFKNFLQETELFWHFYGTTNSSQTTEPYSELDYFQAFQKLTLHKATKTFSDHQMYLYKPNLILFVNLSMLVPCAISLNSEPEPPPPFHSGILLN